jgi:uncharacterized protein (DUF3820 family)
MSWRVMPFGKYEGKTLPEVIPIDLDWFYWALPKLYGKIGEEAQVLARKVRAIKIPGPHRKRLEVEYRYERDDRFRGFTFVKASSGQHSRWSTRLPYLDLSQCLRRRYDKRGGRILLRDFRKHYFGEHKRLTKKRCEKFFSDRRNFIEA